MMGSPIILSEWKQFPEKYGVKKVRRVEYTFDSIVKGEDKPLYENQNKSKQLNLFNLNINVSDEDNLKYKFDEVYKELKIKIKWYRLYSFAVSETVFLYKKL